ncbi:lytic transglycosylase domain-containing protein [Acetobacter sp. TBRC 12305]|uniref:Lytic transglycosylase domain-containing protein n=1 Tax=Acetobacter garciniae TaxID=2817435 RepID=A0A939HIS3_9PROT|nr:lytic transglycosylase domain-containing protein [Acetobacter garciniae]MBO1324197.1 lytic transglycosylase domain-containing protein [Acetobacter garciniae]MBX0343886.1 lytic transglycosylase domain-containing protein [Acetobacter garciniae]
MQFYSLSRRQRLVVAVSVVGLALGGCSAPSASQDLGAARTNPPALDAPVANAPIPSTSPPVPEAPALPVAERLKQWLNLVNAPKASAQDYADFLAERPVWPRRQQFATLMEQALATETDPAVLQHLCSTQQLRTAAALVQCQTQLADQPGLSARFLAQAAQAWTNGNDSASAAALLTTHFASVLTPAKSWARFDREESGGLVDAARRTVPYLAADKQALAQARLALRTSDANAEGLVAALPAASRGDPFLVLDYVRWLRKQQRYDEAVAAWKTEAAAAERATHAAAFWHERDTLARELLQESRPADALAIANDTLATGANRLDAQFLSGWIALRQLHDASAAEEFFRPLVSSASLLTRSRGFYWLGRARAQTEDEASARANWQQAALLPTTFYGQLAAAALEGQDKALFNPSYVARETVRRLKDIERSEPAALQDERISGSDLAQAAQILADSGDRLHAREFLNMLEQQTTDTRGRRALSALADKLGVQDIAVTIARHAGRDGELLLRTGWPQPYEPPAKGLPAGFVLGLTRQESSFDPDAVSPSNAIGLMQLKPSTAADMIQVSGLPPTAATASGLHDPTYNMELGTAYLLHMQDRFGPVLPYLAAAYNCGPTRLGRWMATAGDPVHADGDDAQMIDWIENIPFAETRNYVQRVWENMIIYVALGEKT